MTQRIVYEFLDQTGRQSKQWACVKKLLRNAGATQITKPLGNPPHILTAVLPNEEQARTVVEQLQQLQGVGRADLDATRGILI